jgi:Tfp pilus assembly protein PilO
MVKTQVSLSGYLRTKQLGLLAVLGVVLVIIVLGPVSARLRERLATKKKLVANLESLRVKLDVLSGIDSVLIDERVKKMEAVFPSHKPVVELISTLSQLSGKHGLSFGGVSLTPGSLEEAEAEDKAKKSAKEAGLLDLKFGFQVGGNFDDILAFMSDLENIAPLMKIEQVALSIKTNPLFQTEITLVIADIKVAAFYQPPPKSLGAVTKPVELLSRDDEAVLNQLVNFKTFEAVFPVAPTGKADLFGSGPSE